MNKIEVNMIVKDSLKAVALYEKIFNVERSKVTNFPKGQNEAMFSIEGMYFHLLDENPDYGMIAPAVGMMPTFWINVTVPDILKTFQSAIEAGCKEIQAITKMPDHGLSNAMFSDMYGYVWLLHQVHQEVSFEERTKKWEEKLKK